MIKYCISIIYECDRCKNWYEFDFDLFLNVVILYCLYFYFYFYKNIFFFFFNYILLVEYLMVFRIFWILIGICKKRRLNILL